MNIRFRERIEDKNGKHILFPKEVGMYTTAGEDATTIYPFTGNFDEKKIQLCRAWLCNAMKREDIKITLDVFDKAIEEMGYINAIYIAFLYGQSFKQE